MRWIYQLYTVCLLNLGNLKARSRAVVLRGIANQYKGLVLGTENHTEHMVGYFTIGGDEESDIEVLSPFVKPGTVSNTPYNHYSMLKTIEDLFGLGHLGYAGQKGLAAFGSDVFSAADRR